MKKITTVFYVFAVLTLFVLISGCGSSKKEIETGEITDNDMVDADNDIAADDNEDVDADNSDETEDADTENIEPDDNNTATEPEKQDDEIDDTHFNYDCLPGEYTCGGNLLMSCNGSGYWENIEDICYSGCHPSGTKCIGSACVDGESEYKCMEVMKLAEDNPFPFDVYEYDYYSTTCEYGYNKIIQKCEDECDPETGKCKNEGCLPNDYQCSESGSETRSMHCRSGFWEVGKVCDGECDTETGRCKEACPEVEGNMWSSFPYAHFPVDWFEAVDYCNNLTECGYSDWRMPTIDELRTLIQNCPQTESGGKCRISEENGKLYTNAWYPQGYCYCDWKDDSYYSKLGDSNQIVLWSSSERSDVSDSAWLVLFGDARVNAQSKYGSVYGFVTVRCVR